MRLALPVHSYALRSTPASPARLVNCYAEQLPPDAKTPLILTRAPGIKAHSTPGNGPIRGMHTFKGDIFVVSGTELYKVSKDGTETIVGSIPGSGSVSMDHNINSLVIVRKPDAYYTTGSGVTQITDGDFTARGAEYVKFLDNYMVFMEPGTGRLFWADVGTVTDYNSLSFITAEGNPDNNVGFESDQRQAIVLGEKSGEIWQFDSAGLVRAINGFFELGCFNGDTIAKLDNSIFWVANDYTVRKLEGVTPVRVSTHAVEQFLSTVDIRTLRAFSYTQDGHFFYVLSCSTGCYVFDVVTREWAERATYPENYFNWQYHCSAHGREYVGDYYSNSIGYFDPLTYTDNGGIQRMEGTFQPVYAEHKLALHRWLELVFEPGVGLTTGQGSDPEVMLSCSDDGGKTYKNLPNQKLGKIGEYQWRVRWFGLGSSRMRVYRFAISDPVKVTLSDAILEVEGGRL